MQCDLLDALGAARAPLERALARRWVAQLVRPPRFPRLVPII